MVAFFFSLEWEFLKKQYAISSFAFYLCFEIRLMAESFLLQNSHRILQVAAQPNTQLVERFHSALFVHNDSL